MSDSPPDWAVKRAEALWHENSGTPLGGVGTLKQTFARYIAAHEEPPVDPLLIEAREIVAKWWEQNPGRFKSYTPEGFRDGKYDGDPTVAQALAALKRGVELGKEQDR